MLWLTSHHSPDDASLRWRHNIADRPLTSNSATALTAFQSRWRHRKPLSRLHSLQVDFRLCQKSLRLLSRHSLHGRQLPGAADRWQGDARWRHSGTVVSWWWRHQSTSSDGAPAAAVTSDTAVQQIGSLLGNKNQSEDISADNRKKTYGWYLTLFIGGFWEHLFRVRASEPPSVLSRPPYPRRGIKNKQEKTMGGSSKDVSSLAQQKC